MQSAINKFASATVDSNGNVTLPFLENPGQGMQWQVNVNVMNSPSAAIWTLTVGFQQVGNWTGSAPFGPVKAINQETLTVQGKGLQPGLVVNGQISGWADVDDGSIVIPNNVPNTAISVETTVPVVVAGTGVIVGGQTFFTISPPSNTRRLTLGFHSNNGNKGAYQVVGNTSGIVWDIQNLFWVPASLGYSTKPYFSAAIEPSIDSTFTINVTGSNGDIINVYCVAAQTNPMSVISSSLSPVLVTFTGAYAPAKSSSALMGGNGTTVLIPHNVAGNLNYLNTLFLVVAGNASANIIESRTNTILLSNLAGGQTTLSFSGYQVDQTSDILLAVSNYVSGAIEGGATWAVGP